MGCTMTRAAILGVVVWVGAVVSPGRAPVFGQAGGAAPKEPSGGSFTRLAPLPAPTIVAKATEFPGGGYKAANLVDGDVRTEYSSAGLGTKTFVEFDFGSSIRLAAFRHIDRNDPAAVGASELICLDERGSVIATVPVAHVNKPAGETFFVLPSPVTARRVKWHVTGLGPNSYATVGGAEIAFFTTAGTDSAPLSTIVDVSSPSVLERAGEVLRRPLYLTIAYPYAEPVEAVLRIDGLEPKTLSLRFGSQGLGVSIPASQTDTTLAITLGVSGRTVLRREVPLKPVRKSVIYILPHSHVDIGYTELQTDVERKQIANIARGIELARATAANPEGARYKWNVEVLWAVESYLRQASPARQQEFVEAVRKGWVGLDAMYGNELTGLCRPEELVRLFSYATRLADRCGVPIESAMISDVPGYAWGVISVMAQAGVRYWSIGPNYFDTIGTSMVAWENKPFYWVGPTGRDKVLCWVPYQGYAISHILRSNLTSKFILDLMAHLDKTGYPYDLIHLRWSGHGDNARPDETIPDIVKAWNVAHESPRLVIATTTEAFSEFERRYGSTLPKVRGDWTPYWENGAASSARETAINRASAERLTQAETLWALLHPAPFPAAGFHDAWRNVLLYSEHTWGAHNSVTEPDSQFVKDQWKIKQAFALDGERQSVDLLKQVLAAPAHPAGPSGGVDVFNTTSWVRTDLVTLPKGLSAAGDRVAGPDGSPVPSQRLSNGDLAFLACDLPPFAARRYSVSAGAAARNGRVVAGDLTLENEILSVRLDAGTGAIVELKARGLDGNLADARTIALNDYFFVVGTETRHPLRAGKPTISVKEAGPLVASLLVESEAPGCNRLSREVRLIAGQDRVELINTLDKKRAGVRGQAGREAKEGVHFGFAFNVPDGVIRMDTPWAMVRPETDQLPGACKNWFTVQRWVDVSNADYGVTWATIDAPMIEVGSITANLTGSQTNPKAWITHLDATQTLYSMAMNNHWHTNYCAYQEGVTTFRYAIQAHRAFTPDAAARFGTALSQPLIAVQASGTDQAGAPASRILAEPRLRVEPADVVVTAFKPSDDGKASIVRLFGASGRNAQATLRWSNPAPQSVWLSETSEKPIRKIEGPIDVPAWGIVTLRAE
jgi:alpha-mannosidase